MPCSWALYTEISSAGTDTFKKQRMQDVLSHTEGKEVTFIWKAESDMAAAVRLGT